jgi:hypothetical protein
MMPILALLVPPLALLLSLPLFARYCHSCLVRSLLRKELQISQILSLASLLYHYLVAIFLLFGYLPTYYES